MRLVTLCTIIAMSPGHARPRRRAIGLRALGVATALLALSLAPGTVAAEEEIETGLGAFYPLITRRAVLETQLELNVAHEKGSDGRETTTSLGIDYVILPRWQLSLTVPLVVNDPRGQSANAGIGDVSIENTFQLFRSADGSKLLSAGFEARLPTGSRKRGLGGDPGIEPFVSASVAVQRFYLVGEASYDWSLDAPAGERREQQATVGAAVGYQIERLVPMIELTTVTKTRGPDDDLLHRIQVYLTPGFTWQVFHDGTLGLGVQLPLTHARAFDYALLGRFNLGF
jgi:outer membrane putative beta-barrel porin/alpha-amylase